MAGTITRGKVIRADLAQWDGKTATHSRIDATGGTVTGLAIGNEVDVLQVYGSGTSRTRGTIADAVQRIGSSTNVTLVFAPGTWTIDVNLTIPSNLTCHIPAGCLFSVDSGITLTFSGDVHVEDPEAWYTGSGTVVVSREGVHGAVWHRTAAERSGSVTPSNFSFPPGDIRRYGGDPSGAAASTSAFEAAQDAHPECVYFPEGTFLIDGPQLLVSNTRITCTPDTIVRVPSGGMSTDIGWMRMRDVTDIVIEGNGSLWDFHTKPAANENRHIFDIRGGKRITISNVRTEKAGGDGVYVGAGVTNAYSEDITLNNIQADNCRRQGISIVSAINCHVNGGSAENITGTSPQSGMDIEPNTSTDELKGIRIKGFRTRECTGQGILCVINDLAADYDLDIVIEGHSDYGSLIGFAARFGSQMTGQFRYVDGLSVDAHENGMEVRGWESDSTWMQLIRPTVVNPNNDSVSPADSGNGIAIYGSASDTQTDIGRVLIVNPVIVDNRGGSALMKNCIRARTLVTAGAIRDIYVIDPLQLTGATSNQISLVSVINYYVSDPLLVTEAAKTSNFTFSISQHHSHITNTGAAGTVTITLDDDIQTNPSEVTFTVRAAQEFRIDPEALSSILPGGGAGVHILSSVIGSSITLKRASTTTWEIVRKTGDWRFSTSATPELLAGSATYDPGSLADAAGATTTVTVTGAALGDFAEASFSLDLQGITVTAWVSAADTVSVRFQNESGGLLDLASGTLRARVRKA